MESFVIIPFYFTLFLINILDGKVSQQQSHIVVMGHEIQICCSSTEQER